VQVRLFGINTTPGIDDGGDNGNSAASQSARRYHKKE
jgi:hypothetical protein